MRGMPRIVSIVTAAALSVAACGSDTPSIEEAQERFCGEVESYVTALDSYGGLFSDAALTVGQVRSARDVLEPARDDVVAAAEEFRRAVEEGSSPGVTIEIVEPETLAAVQAAVYVAKQVG